MFERCRRKLDIFCSKLRFVPGYYIVVPVILLLAAFIIRLATGGTHLIYNVLDGRGIFPGPFLYFLSYSVRLILCGIILSFALFTRYLYEERIKALIPALAAATLLLLEYKLIFGGVSLVLAFVFTLLIPLFCAVVMVVSRSRNKTVLVAGALMIILQAVFFVQLVSLAISI